MAQDCSLQMPEDFVLPLLPAEELKDKYRRYLFRDYVEVCVCAESVCSGIRVLDKTSPACGKGVRRRGNIQRALVLFFFFPFRNESLNLLHTVFKSESILTLFCHSLHSLSSQLGFHLYTCANHLISQIVLLKDPSLK